MNHDIDPGIREYTRVYTIPEPVICNGIIREILLLGKAGKIWLMTLNPKIEMKDRMCRPPGGSRPVGCYERSDQSSSVLLMTNGGEILVAGGCSDNALQRFDVYNIKNDSWKSFDGVIRRGIPVAILLPDGKVMIINGENSAINQNSFDTVDSSLDTRYPQIFDPENEKIVIDSQNRDPRYRGYHNGAALLPDGSLLVGGGFNQYGDVGCENTDLIIYKPSYLMNGDRSTITNIVKGSKVYANTTLEITYQGPLLSTNNGASLVSVQSMTHSYGQNQRYVRLNILQLSNSKVTVQIPSMPVVVPGEYYLFLINKNGVPSSGKFIFIYTILYVSIYNP